MPVKNQPIDINLINAAIDRLSKEVKQKDNIINQLVSEKGTFANQIAEIRGEVQKEQDKVAK